MDEEYDHDGGLAMYESRNKKGTREKQAQRQKAAQVADYRCADSGPRTVSACGMILHLLRSIEHHHEYTVL